MLIFREIPCTALAEREPQADALLSLWQGNNPLPMTESESALVVYEDDKLIGISIISAKLTDTKPKCAVIPRLIMAPEVRRHGLGRMLMGQTAGAALNRGAYFAAAQIPDTAEAAGFAASIGFKKTPLFDDMLVLDLTDVEGMRHGTPKLHE